MSFQIRGDVWMDTVGGGGGGGGASVTLDPTQNAPSVLGLQSGLCLRRIQVGPAEEKRRLHLIEHN